ncbi:MAG: TOBE domain-containing protein, partial [Actinobacteria bacterium]|nr:TOBE domain-containing protein [Actinomycetota bacterium]
MDAGRVLQIGAPTEIYDRPRTRFVADFIGDTNLLDLTVAPDGSGRLADGTVVRLPDDAPQGGDRTAAIRPEKLGIVRRDAPRDPSLDAVVGTVQRRTFLGNALLYEVSVPAGGRAPMSISVRQGNAPGIEHVEVGEPVRVRWSPASLAVLED